MGLNHGQDRQATAANIARRALRHGWLPTLICIVALLAAAGGEAATALLRYERALLQDGEYWRLISGHFVHLGWAHLVLNVTALLLVWLLVGNRLSGSSWLLSCALIIATIDAGFWWLDTGLDWYVGFSGVLHGMLLAGLLGNWQPASGEAWILLAVLVAKLLYEQFAGPLPGSVSSAGGPVVVNAHLYGAVGGLLAAALVKIRVARRPSI